jgi:hypothetical protein
VTLRAKIEVKLEKSKLKGSVKRRQGTQCRQLGRRLSIPMEIPMEFTWIRPRKFNGTYIGETTM